MARFARRVGTAFVVAGLLTTAWSLVVWQWKDPVTEVYARLEQRELGEGYESQLRRFRTLAAANAVGEGRQGPPGAAAVARERVAALARRYRATLRRGDALGRLVVPRLGLDAYVVEGTDSETLRRGPGRYPRSFLPGEGQLVYIAGHRTTYGAPFAEIDRLRRGDVVRLELPYGTFEYRITGHRIVAADAVSVLRSDGREVVALQACHPRFFASHRYIAYATPAGRGA